MLFLFRLILHCYLKFFDLYFFIDHFVIFLLLNLFINNFLKYFFIYFIINYYLKIITLNLIILFIPKLFRLYSIFQHFHFNLKFQNFVLSYRFKFIQNYNFNNLTAIIIFLIFHHYFILHQKNP
jgi:hypothetical protein